MRPNPQEKQPRKRPLKMAVEVEAVSERDAGWLALMRWLLADDDAHFLDLSVSESEQASTEEPDDGV